MNGECGIYGCHLRNKRLINELWRRYRIWTEENKQDERIYVKAGPFKLLPPPLPGWSCT